MQFTRRHEQDLAEIKALHRELDQRATETVKQLTLIQRVHGIKAALPKPAAEGQRVSRPPADGNDAPPLLAFVHIPKTAGGTVTSMLAAAYPEEGLGKSGNYLHDSDRSEWKVVKRSGKGWEDWRRAGGRVVTGHTPYGVFREHLPPDTRYMTFLREPIDRVLSHYHRHIRRRDPSRAGSPKELAKRRSKANSLHEALVEMRLPDLRNVATRFLCSDPSPPDDLSESALDDAKANLREFAFVGLQERFQESIILLQRTLDLSLVPPGGFEDRHISTDRPTVEEIPDSDRELIADCNGLDIELYRFAQGLFGDTGSVAAGHPQLISRSTR